MKRHIQEPGVRKWSGNDLLELQSEPLRIADGFFSQWGDCVICGCAVSAGTLGAGLASIGGLTLPVSETEVRVWPVFLVADEEHIQREYADDVVRDIAVSRFAKVVQTRPEEGTPYVEIAEDGTPGFFEKLRAAWLTELKAAVTDLRGKVRNNTDGLTALAQVLDGHTAKLSGIESLITSLQQADLLLADDITDLEAADITHEGRIGSLENKMPREIDHIPGVNDSGYAIGQEVWFTGTDGNKTFYKCHDNTAGAAVWRESGEGSGGGSHSGAVFLAGTTNINEATVLIKQGYID